MSQQHEDRGGVQMPLQPAPSSVGRVPRLHRRAMLVTLSGFGAAGLVLALVGPVGRLLGPPDRGFPSWVSTMPRGAEAYAAALDHPHVLANVPCYCGCMSFEQAHRDLRDCFVQASGELEPHGAFCETCQSETLDAVAWAEQGVSHDEIRARIIARYSDLEPAMGGTGCGGATDDHAESDGAGAACAP